MRKPKNKFEFSKLIIAIFGIIEIGVTLFTCYMVKYTCDTTPLMYLIPSVSIVGAAGVKHYYQKARLENKIKLMNAYHVEMTQEAFNSNDN